MAGNIGIGMMQFIPADKPGHFLTGIILARLVLGFGDSLCMTAIFSTVASRFNTEKQRYIGLVESALGFGEMIGPPLSSFIFGSAGMGWVFFTFAIINFFNLICLLMFLPATQENTQQEGDGNNFKNLIL